MCVKNKGDVLSDTPVSYNYLIYCVPGAHVRSYNSCIFHANIFLSASVAEKRRPFIIKSLSYFLKAVAKKLYVWNLFHRSSMRGTSLFVNIFHYLMKIFLISNQYSAVIISKFISTYNISENFQSISTPCKQASKCNLSRVTSINVSRPHSHNSPLTHFIYERTSEIYESILTIFRNSSSQACTHSRSCIRSNQQRL